MGLTAVGEGHSLVWQFIPYCVFISKAGEAFNVHPIFVYDKTIESAITIAKEQEARYKEWYTEKMGKTAMPKGWVEVVSIASGRIHYLHVESGHTSYVRPRDSSKKISQEAKRLAKEEEEEKRREEEEKAAEDDQDAVSVVSYASAASAVTTSASTVKSAAFSAQMAALQAFM